MTVSWKRSQLQRSTRRESIVKTARAPEHPPRGLRGLHALQVILEPTQLDLEEVDQIQLIPLEQADQANQEYQGLSPYQNDLRISCPSEHQDHLKEPPQRGEISMQKVMLNHR